MIKGFLFGRQVRRRLERDKSEARVWVSIKKGKEEIEVLKLCDDAHCNNIILLE